MSFSRLRLIRENKSVLHHNYVFPIWTRGPTPRDYRAPNYSSNCSDATYMFCAPMNNKKGLLSETFFKILFVYLMTNTCPALKSFVSRLLSFFNWAIEVL